jgi:hypothetical protein
MKQGRLLDRGTLWLPLLLLLGSFACFPADVLATDLPMIGGLDPPGNYLGFECQKGSYLVGLKGKRGDWIDRIAAVCAPWLPAEQTFGRTSVGSFFGTSEGGRDVSTVCWGSGVRNRAVQSWTYNFEYLQANKHYVLAFIQAHCVSLAPSAETGILVFGPRSFKYQQMQGPYEGPPPNQACPAGEIAVGMHVRAALFVYAIGLICGPPPSLGAIATQVNPLAATPERPATKVNPLAVAPATGATNVNPLAKAAVSSDDMFTIVTPVWNDRVQQGQVVVKLAPPKIGMTQITQLEFKWLDAPPTQPYVNKVAVDTNSLLQGYAVPQPVTRGQEGRWEIRARASGKAVPGPWSFPVQFRLFLTQPTQSFKQTSPIQQTAPLPSSGMTAPSPVQQVAPQQGSLILPSPSGSGSTQMKRSPSMIMPRGIEGKAEKPNDQSVEEAAKTETKP